MLNVSTPVNVLYTLYCIHNELKDFRSELCRFDFKGREKNFSLVLNDQVVPIGTWINIHDTEEVDSNKTKTINHLLTKPQIKVLEDSYIKANEACKYTLIYLLNIVTKYPDLYRYQLEQCLPTCITKSTLIRDSVIENIIAENKPLYDYLLQQEVIKGLLE